MSRSAAVGFAASILLAVALTPSGPVNAGERINRFHSDITINADASMAVTETIEVTVEGREIRRGIYRDIPTSYEDRLGNRVFVAFDVLDVRRNGEPEPYRIEKIANGVRIRIGQSDRMLPHGRQVFTIVYRTTRQLGFFRSFDELYWNVTGNGWAFVIDQASATVHLPAGATSLRRTAYTGAQGASGREFRSSESSGGWTFETTAALGPGEGLTIAISWPKGFVREPGTADRLRWFLDDNAATGMAAISTLLIFGYYIFAWRRFGRDPEPGAIIPRFRPPKGLSPAASRFIRRMSFDRKGFSAALINMAVKGYLTVEEDGDSYELHKEKTADFEALANGERRVAKRIFAGSDFILLDNKNHEVLGKSVKSLKESLKFEYEGAYFKRNTLLFVFGFVLSIVMIFSTAAAGNDPGLIPRAVIAAGACGLIVFLVLHFWGDYSMPSFSGSSFRMIASSASVVTVFNFILVGIMVMGGSSGGGSMNLFSNPVQIACFAVVGGLHVIFFFLLKRPTLAGRSIMDEIEGFRMYLGVAEAERLNLLNPPENTPELFEAYLPYALALDVENEWSERFASILRNASMAPGESGYSPRWYRGNAWRADRVSSFSSRLGNSLGAAVASSVTPPGSSSGSGGGGFSGGGGGGGGGGGW